jgi:hypothetical protein
LTLDPAVAKDPQQARVLAEALRARMESTLQAMAKSRLTAWG